MVALGVFVMWAGYAVALWGYCLVRGKCVTPANIVSWKFPQSVAGG